VQRSHAMPTRSPARGPLTSWPTRSTRPTTWWPGTIGERTSGSSPSTTCRSVRQTPHAATRTSTSPAAGSGTARSVAPSGAVSMGAGRTSCIARIARSATRGRFVAGARDDLQRPGEVRSVHHLPLERDRIHAPRAMLLEGGDERARVGEDLGRGRERGVDDGNLVGMDGDLPGEAHGHAFLAFAPQAVEIGDVGVD